MRNDLIGLVLLLSGCAGCALPPAQPPKIAHSEWLPEKGIEWAIADCEAKSAGISGYDWIDAASKRGDARRACLKAYGIQP